MQRAVLPASGSNALAIAGDICTVARQSEVAWFLAVIIQGIDSQSSKVDSFVMLLHSMLSSAY